MSIPCLTFVERPAIVGAGRELSTDVSGGVA
jgi:hypothetical protein